MCETLKKIGISLNSFLIHRRAEEGEGGMRGSWKKETKGTGRAERTLTSIILGSNEETWSV